ncbi:MAG: hypothetical protein F6K30_30825, partial [Cyanothece sp. SIO2G6]|nr:hypothetical protein [Cyanothece sp. SIO2G6]
MIDLDPVFNDLSCQPLAVDKYEASQRMESLVTVLVEAPDNGLGSSLRINDSFHILEIAKEYTMTDWFFDSELPKEARDFLVQLSTKSPLLAEQKDEVILDAELCEVRVGDFPSEAFRAAYLVKTPLVSL